MEKPKQRVSDKNVMVSSSKKLSSTTNYFDLISSDLVIHILSKLPLKSIAKCRCVSKLWSSIIRRQNYNTLFPIKSPVTPRFFLAFLNCRGLFFSSSHQPQNPDHNSSLVTTVHHIPMERNYNYRKCPPVRGLICHQHMENEYSVAMICNPFTGESLTLPKKKIGWLYINPMYGRVIYYLGYDPIEKQFKVLRITWLCHPGNSSAEYHVLTLENGNGNLLWREVQCFTMHYPLWGDSVICINGVLYYTAETDKGEHNIFCFDIRSENFRFIDLEQHVETRHMKSFTLIDYNSQLGACFCDNTLSHFEFWVLEDFNKHKWSKRFYPISLPRRYERSGYRPAGMTGSGEIVMYSDATGSSHDCVVLYYNLETKTTRTLRLKVEGLKYDTGVYYRVYAFANYVENVNLI